MNFFDALNAHAAWKQRLVRHLEDPAGHPISAAAAGRPDQCALGRWLAAHGDDHAQLGALQEAHAALHRAVEAVVQAAADDPVAARRLLEGQFVPASVKLQKLLRALAVAGLKQAG